ncbi:GMC family oxidoreductase [Endozoicomonas numazuensis]|uniref:GMC family oxidoreductase n=1 Tax=Endozoicomonas numazuensis TaxID=1137799 RepID=UPI00055483A2|nr:choline dehydrogenase [Endozoicomonas numazuensis]
MTEFDYIIVGGGSAGCVLANRLSENPEHNVCLVEAGGSDKSPLIYTPAGSAITVPHGMHNWQLNALAQSTMNNRDIYCPRGKTLGGSSSINAMLYIRGQKQDYDQWADLGNEGWSFDEVLPYFRKAQNQERGASDFHGVGGPLNVADPRSQHCLSEAFIKGAVETGEKENPDFNGAEQEGVGWYQVTQKGGQRCSSAAAYLHPVMDRPNLTVMTGSHTARVLLNGKKAIGIEIVRGVARRKLFARKEVILSAGAFGSPQVMLLSGIGARDKLEPHKIECLHELSGVGENLQEHPDVLVVANDKTASSVAFARPLGVARGIRDVVKYMCKKEGFLTSSLAESGGFIKSSPEVERPDLQLHFIPAAMEDHGRKLSRNLQYGFTIHVCVLRPESRGRVFLQSALPTDDPGIELNLLAKQADMDCLIRGVKKVRKIIQSSELSRYAGEEYLPGANVEGDDSLESYIRNNANHIYHPVGTCKMGVGELAVVDTRLRVHGLDGLRVVDASIMPTLISGNTNAPAIMIAEKAADMILADQGLKKVQDSAVFMTEEIAV